MGNEGSSARRLIEDSSFGPEALKVIGQAFELAWAEIRGHFGDDPEDVDMARYQLATAMLSVASDNSRDVDEVKKAALEAIALRIFHETLELLGREEAPVACAGNGNWSTQPLASHRADSLGTGTVLLRMPFRQRRAVCLTAQLTLAKLDAKGIDTSAGRDVLATMTRSVENLRAHRRMAAFRAWRG